MSWSLNPPDTSPYIKCVKCYQMKKQQQFIGKDGQQVATCANCRKRASECKRERKAGRPKKVTERTYSAQSALPMGEIVNCPKCGELMERRELNGHSKQCGRK